ncbi:MAG: hypothetical protein ABIN24_13180 [Dyadobacter sp.]
MKIIKQMCKILFINQGVIVQNGLRRILVENFPFDLLYMVSDSTESIGKGQYDMIIVGTIKTDISELIKK